MHLGADEALWTDNLRRRAPDLYLLAYGTNEAFDTDFDADRFAGLDLRGMAVLVHTGWARHWRTDTYFEDHPFLTGAAAARLVEAGAALVGIDSHNIDDTRTRARPAHTLLLGAGIPICEHMRGLELLPDAGFRFTAAPPKVKAFGTFPVRAFAQLG